MQYKKTGLNYMNDYRVSHNFLFGTDGVSWQYDWRLMVVNRKATKYKQQACQLHIIDQDIVNAH